MKLGLFTRKDVWQDTVDKTVSRMTFNASFIWRKLFESGLISKEIAKEKCKDILFLLLVAGVHMSITQLRVSLMHNKKRSRILAACILNSFLAGDENTYGYCDKDPREYFENCTDFCNSLLKHRKPDEDLSHETVYGLWVTQHIFDRKPNTQTELGIAALLGTFLIELKDTWTV